MGTKIVYLLEEDDSITCSYCGSTCYEYYYSCSDGTKLCEDCATAK